ncbi:MAG: peptide chain release factor N(5)-glutamine methyltransferase [Pyrinomonadaceae bacterium]
METSIAEAILQAARQLRKAGVSEGRREAASLMSHALQRDRSFVLSHADDPVSHEQLEFFLQCVKRRAHGEPLQYITAHQEFYGLDFEVTSDVLIPRPETELLVETAIDLIKPYDRPPFICDVGTGSGCIVIALLHELHHFPEARAIALDVSSAALSVARRNAMRHSLAQRIDFVVSDCFAALDQTPVRPNFDLIVSNPPYVRESSLDGLQKEVRDFEPRTALVAGPDGLAIIRRLLLGAVSFLKPGGHILFEIGFDQGEAVEQLIDRECWEILRVHEDLQGIPRIVALRKPRE